MDRTAAVEFSGRLRGNDIAIDGTRMPLLAAKVGLPALFFGIFTLEPQLDYPP
jgi:hypothetical protein